MLRPLLFALSLLGLAAQASAEPPDADRLKAGRTLYEEGILPDGSLLKGVRVDGSVALGRQAACANCHRASGMGMVEGDILVPPITGRYLFREADDLTAAVQDPRVGRRLSTKRPPYTEQSFQDSVIKGLGSDGRDFGALMPKFELSVENVALLSDYLKGLNRQPSPGVSGRTIHLATVIAPGVEPERRQILIDMLRTSVVQKNGSTVTTNANRRHMVPSPEMMLGTENRWILDVWDLEGKPETWGEQLRQFASKGKPFALISGLSNGTWAPVEAFCEREQVPCWFPSIVDTPAREVQPKYSVYFSRGLSLDAAVVVDYLKDRKDSGTLVQLYRGSEAGVQVVRLLHEKWHAETGKKSIEIDLDRTDGKALSHTLASLKSREISLVAWLGKKDLGTLPALLPQRKPVRVFASGRLLHADLGGLPPELSASLRIIYPYELPSLRRTGSDYMKNWLQLRNLPLVDEPLQSEVYFAMSFLADTLSEMLGNLYGDYLVERADTMINQREARKVEDQLRDQNSIVRKRGHGRTPMTGAIPVGSRQSAFDDNISLGTTVYPRLSLGTNQRYASNGAYIVRLQEAPNGGTTLVAESDWITP